MFADMTMLRKLMFLKAASGGSVVEDTATGNPVTFMTDIARTLKSLIVNFLPVQSGTGDPSPTNVRPITGWTGVTVNHGEKNLVGCTIGETKSNNGIDYAILSDGGQKCKGTANGTSYGIEMQTGVTLPSGKYTLSVTGAVNVKTVIVKNGAYFREITGSNSTTFLLSESATIRFYTTVTNGTAVDETVYIQLEVGETATSYEPYTAPTSYPVTWISEGTVYGGYVDLVTGEVWGTWGEIASYDGETLPGRWLSDRDVYSAGGTPTTGAQVVYEFASPVLITTITPAQITALIGNNTVWSDANGDCEVTFLKKG